MAATPQDNQIPENAEEKLSKCETQLKLSTERVAQLETNLKTRDEELAASKARVVQLEEELAEALKFKAQHARDAEVVDELKTKSEETLTRAKAIIFDKTKVIKNQELQLDALNQQIVSLKDVVSITKDLLEIRNLEIKQLENKITAMEGRVGAEKERHDLMHKKLEHMIRYNGELKREYETQLCLFSALRERYSERELAKGVVAQEQAAAAQPAGGDEARAEPEANEQDKQANGAEGSSEEQQPAENNATAGDDGAKPEPEPTDQNK